MSSIAILLVNRVSSGSQNCRKEYESAGACYSVLWVFNTLVKRREKVPGKSIKPVIMYINISLRAGRVIPEVTIPVLYIESQERGINI